MSDYKVSDFTHLLYVRKYNIIAKDYILCVYGVKTNDILHTVGEIYYRSFEEIKRIDFVKCTQSSLDYIKEKGLTIYPFKDKYKAGDL